MPNSDSLQFYQQVLDYIIFAVSVVVIVTTITTIIIYRKSKNGAQNSRVRIAIGPFPDSIPLIIAKEEKLFGPIDVSLTVVSWQKLPDELENEKFDVVLANKAIIHGRVAKTENQNLDYKRDLVFYDGFALLTRPDNPKGFLSYTSIPNMSDPDGTKTLLSRKKVLSQIRGQLIIASGDTDHALCVHKCAAMGDVKDNEYELVDKYDSDIGFAHFINGAGDIFAGGITHRLLARKLGAIEIISEQVVALNTHQRNGLVSITAPDPIIMALEEGWFRAVATINANKVMYGQKFVTHLNTIINKRILPRIVDKQTAARLHLTYSDFELIWNNWETFPESRVDVSAEAKKRKTTDTDESVTATISFQPQVIEGGKQKS